MWKDSETEIDFLNFDYLVNTITEVVRNDTLVPSTIGVYGDWGSGKSSLIQMSRKELEKEEGVVCISFNGWLFENYDDAKTAILGSVLDAIRKNRKLSKTAEKCFKGLMSSIDKFKLITTGLKVGVSILSGGIPASSLLSMESVVSTILATLGLKIESIDKDTLEKVKNSITDELDNSKLRENIREFQNEFENLLEETKIKRLVVFIDELDRCNPDTILNTLEAIRLFLFRGNVSFIIGADERQIQYAVKRKFSNIEGIDFDIGKEYLEKLIQYPIKIPRLDGREMELYISCLFFQKLLEAADFEKLVGGIKKKGKDNLYEFQLDFDKVKDILGNNCEIEPIKDCLAVAQQLSTVLTNGLYGNPRQCKRFLNSLSMRESMAKFKEITIKRNILAKFMMLEYFRPQLFKVFAKLYEESKLIKELEIIEERGISEGEILKEWDKDDWFDIWIKSSPSLHSAGDLRPYFYLTRDALINRVVSNANKLSPQAIEILNLLKSGTDIEINNALKKANDISDYEANEILKNMFNEFLSDSRGDASSFKAFIRWGVIKKSLFGETLSLLMSIPQSKIKLSFIPLFGEFGKSINQKLKIKNWLLEIISDNQIRKAIEDLEE